MLEGAEREGSGEVEVALGFGGVDGELFCWLSRWKAAMRSLRFLCVGSLDPVAFVDLYAGEIGMSRSDRQAAGDNQSELTWPGA